MTEEERAALDLFLAFETQHHDHFTAQVYRLIAKADAMNRRRMSLSFGLEVEMYEEWMELPSPQIFYDRYRVRQNYKPERQTHAPSIHSICFRDEPIHLCGEVIVMLGLKGQEQIQSRSFFAFRHLLRSGSHTGGKWTSPRSYCSLKEGT